VIQQTISSVIWVKAHIAQIVFPKKNGHGQTIGISVVMVIARKEPDNKSFSPKYSLKNIFIQINI
jgi:hypothetical protein